MAVAAVGMCVNQGEDGRAEVQGKISYPDDRRILEYADIEIKLRAIGRLKYMCRFIEV